MARKIAVSTLNASTVDILNVIRQNAPYDIQSTVPAITQATEIPKVGAVIYGNPAIANYYLSQIINRVALVRAQSATFNNPYARLKKGYIEYGETIEEIFVNIAKVIWYSAEKAEEREFKRTMPDVRSAFHVINWRVMYPITIQDDELKHAFMSAEGVTELIAKIVDSIYTAANIDEFLLFKYMLIKAISHGQMYPVSIGDGTNLSEAAVQYRGISNKLLFPSDKYNEQRVVNTTPRERQVIFMDAMYNAQYDVNVLAAAFNMDKATYTGSLFLIDDWTSFDNARFEVIRSQSTGLEQVTDVELALLANVKAVICDEEWFQVYDNQNKFTEKYVASGLYWNYFYHVVKTVSSSPFANAVCFATNNAIITTDSFDVTVTGVETSEDATILTLGYNILGVTDGAVQFTQTAAATADGIAIQKYGAVIYPASKIASTLMLAATIGTTTYEAGKAISGSTAKGTKITFTKKA